MKIKKKEQVSHGRQPNMAYQDAIRLDTSPYVKAGRRNLARGRGSQEQAKSLTYPVEGLLVASQF